MEDNDSTPDVTLGSPCGCSDNDTVGAENGTPVFSTTQKADGTYSLHIDALDDRYSFSVLSDDLIVGDDFKVTFDLYIVSYPSAGTTMEIIRWVDDADNYVAIRLRGTGPAVQGFYRGQATEDYIEVSAATGSWLSCEYQGKTGIVGNDHYIACAASSTEEDDDLNAMLQSMDTLIFGDQEGSEAGEYYLDNVKVYLCDKY